MQQSYTNHHFYLFVYPSRHSLAIWCETWQTFWEFLIQPGLTNSVPLWYVMMLTSVLRALSDTAVSCSLPEVRTLVQFSHNEVSYRVLFFSHAFFKTFAPLFAKLHAVRTKRATLPWRALVLCTFTLLYVISHNFRLTRSRNRHNIIKLVRTLLMSDY